MSMYSPRFSLTNEDLKKIAIGAGIALLGSLATYLQETIPGVDFGDMSFLVVALNSVIVNTIRRFISEYVY